MVGKGCLHRPGVGQTLHADDLALPYWKLHSFPSLDAHGEPGYLSPQTGFSQGALPHVISQCLRRFANQIALVIEFLALSFVHNQMPSQAL